MNRQRFSNFENAILLFSKLKLVKDIEYFICPHFYEILYQLKMLKLEKLQFSSMGHVMMTSDRRSGQNRLAF